MVFPTAIATAPSNEITGLGVASMLAPKVGRRDLFLPRILLWHSDIRGGPTEAQRTRMMLRMKDEASRITDQELWGEDTKVVKLSGSIERNR
jgi:hypothetical protein